MSSWGAELIVRGGSRVGALLGVSPMILGLTVVALGTSTPELAVGLTAAVSTALARAGIACNMLAGFHHDHLLVPLNRLDDALDVLDTLADVP